MEGTLLKKEYRLDDGVVAPSAWTVLAEELGRECMAEEMASKQKWRSGGYSCYLDWMHYTVEIHRRHGLSEGVFSAVMNSVEFTPNAGEALERIHARGAISVVVTGGFKALADRVQKKLRIRHSFAGCEYFFDRETGLIDHVNLLPADERGKVDFMRLICREYSIDPMNCAFVGDGMNDVHLAREVGYSIAFNAQPELRAVATHCIVQDRGSEDFMEVVIAMENETATGNGLRNDPV